MWISDKDDSGRPIAAEIKNWNNKRMENIYQNFIEGEIKRQIRLFEKRGGDINAFNFDGEGSFMIVEPACNEGIPDIIGTMSPLLFCTMVSSSALSVERSLPSNWILTLNE